MSDQGIDPLHARGDLSHLLDDFALRRAQRVFALVATTGATPADWLVMNVLAARGQAATPSLLWELTGLPASTVTGVLLRLESRGDCVRLKDHHDRRRAYVALTAQGHRRVSDTRALIAEAHQLELEILSAGEVTACHSMLVSLTAVER